ncbi:MAG TPA: VWA domain-containing protein [Actinomycetes bacterium]|nr:VWA domain-containing protein [Actinomycetes bacterium]
MTFESPPVLLLLVLPPLVLAGYLYLQRRRARYAIRYPATGVLGDVVRRTFPWRRWIPVALYLLAMSTMLIGLARPQASIAVPKEEATVLLVMDVSGSMNATDVEPSRIVAARRSATTFVNILPDTFPIGVVAFDESANVLSPPTIDRGETRDVIDQLRADGGTAMGDAIGRALELRPGGVNAPPPVGDQNPNVVMLLLSDGANSTGSDPLDNAEAARKLRIPVYTIALGTPEGALTQFGGRRIPVPPDEATLQLIAQRTGGRFFKAPSDEELRGIYRELGSRIGFKKEEQEVTVVFAAVALLLVAAGATASSVWTSRLS